MREIGSEETPRLYECMEDLARHHNESSVYFRGSYPSIPSEEIVKQFAADMEAGSSHIAVIEDGERFVGLCKINVDAAKAAGVLDYLVVLGAERGNGHGAALMDWALGKFEEYGVKNIEVKVVYGNDVVDFYKRYGFKEKSLILCLRR